jgi:hypothetical protein
MLAGAWRYRTKLVKTWTERNDSKNRSSSVDSSDIELMMVVLGHCSDSEIVLGTSVIFLKEENDKHNKSLLKTTRRVARIALWRLPESGPIAVM